MEPYFALETRQIPSVAQHPMGIAQLAAGSPTALCEPVGEARGAPEQGQFYFQRGFFWGQRINLSDGFLQSRVDVYMAHYPDSTSLKTILHWRQVTLLFSSLCPGAGNNPPALPLQSCMREREESCPEVLYSHKRGPRVLGAGRRRRWNKAW